VRTGEGVFGLRRAFVLAGAKTLVMSLWKVPDEQTRELMEDFYRRILAGEPRAEALRQAQLEMKKKYPDPFYSRRVHLPGRSGAAARVGLKGRRQTPATLFVSDEFREESRQELFQLGQHLVACRQVSHERREIACPMPPHFRFKFRCEEVGQRGIAHSPMRGLSFE
jgi:hypothetical protein